MEDIIANEFSYLEKAYSKLTEKFTNICTKYKVRKATLCIVEFSEQAELLDISIPIVNDYFDCFDLHRIYDVVDETRDNKSYDETKDYVIAKFYENIRYPDLLNVIELFEHRAKFYKNTKFKLNKQKMYFELRIDFGRLDMVLLEKPAEHKAVIAFVNRIYSEKPGHISEQDFINYVDILKKQRIKKQNAKQKRNKLCKKHIEQKRKLTLSS